MQLKIVDHLTKEQKQRLDKLRREKISNREIEELMGTRQQTYKRNRHGAITNR
jgi:IS30 family transposase